MDQSTLLPEQKLEKACNDAATLCQCGWARCIETDGFKASLCCKETFQFKLARVKVGVLRPQLYVPDTDKPLHQKKPDRNPSKHLPIPHAEPPQSTTNSEICAVPPSQPIVIAASSLHSRRSFAVASLPFCSPDSAVTSTKVSSNFSNSFVRFSTPKGPFFTLEHATAKTAVGK
uniref:Uncharacterized protein n=1 Tax=Globodera rostochiensis TaxID=31243 RepID=A0A914GVD3_GLORO